MSEPWLDDRAATVRDEQAEPRDRIEALADLVVNDAVPDDLRPQVAEAVALDFLSPAGDVLGWPDNTTARVYIEGTSLLAPPEEG